VKREFGRGFSLAEVILCLGILAVALVMTVNLFLSVQRGGDKNRHTATGTLVAETVLNQFLHDVYQGVHPTLTKATFFSADASLSGSLALSSTEYFYQIDYQTVVSTAGTELGAGLGGNRLKAVQVTCWWWGAGPTSQRSGQGKLSVQLRKLVNENASF